MYPNKKNINKIIFIWVVTGSLISCVPTSSGKTKEARQEYIPTTTSKPVFATQDSVPIILAPTQVPGVVINVHQYDQEIILKLGQILNIEPPSPGRKWDVEYDHELLKLLTLTETVQSPEPAGWVFQAIAAGKTQVILTSIVSCNKPPCPLMPTLRFQLDVLVQ